VLDTLDAAFQRGTRLASLIGGPGMGKSTAARQFGLRVLERGGDVSQVWWCHLATARSADDVAAIVLRSLGIPVDAPMDLGSGVERVGHGLGARTPLLLILDEFEHLVDHAVETVGAWLVQVPTLRVLVTSRERLRLQGEWVHELSALDDETSRELFVAWSEGNEASSTGRATIKLDELIALLEGNPLAIELAASRSRILGPSGVAKRLHHGLQVLTSSLRNAPTRHRSLTAAIDGSWALLSPPEQAAFAQLSVFRGGFGLEDAERILQLPGDAPPPAWEILESLVDKSLVHLFEPTWPLFALFPILRSYGRDKLDADGSRTELMLRHARCFLDLAENGADPMRKDLSRAGRGSHGLPRGQPRCGPGSSPASRRARSGHSPCTQPRSALPSGRIVDLDPTLSARVGPGRRGQGLARAAV
jgi:predicted ATPase